MAELSVDLVSRDRKVWSGAATQVSAPSADGQIGIMANHTPMLAVLRPGTIKVMDASGSVVEGHTTGGFVSVDHNLVTLVVDEISLV